MSKAFFIKVGPVHYPLTPLAVADMDCLVRDAENNGVRDIVAVPVFIDEGGRLWPKPDAPYEIVTFDETVA